MMSRAFVCEKDYPVVQTKAGKLRGFQLDGIFIFRGIEYARAGRFLPPEPVEPWEGVRDALNYGFVAPLTRQETPNAGELLVPHRYWPMSERCQNLNVWTPTLDPQAKKPVLVWLHGGGFSAGSAIEQQAYDGERMAALGDVVMVSVNHRLNILGYLDVEPFLGPAYHNSCNAGNADLVAALQWVHENIENFGGDPGNVTLFGQSGGGMKVTCLAQTPAADGLFQKGVVMSGVIGGWAREKAPDGRKVVGGMLKALGLDEADAGQLVTLPYERLVEAYDQVAPALREAGEYVGNEPAPNDFYLGDPRYVGFTDHAKTIPLMVGSVLAEFAFGASVPTHNDLTEDQKAALIEEKYGKENAGELIRLFREAWPDKDLTVLLSLDSMVRAASQEYIDCKANCPESGVWSYLFAYDSPYDGGKPAWHCADIPFFFHNTQVAPAANEAGVTDRLEEEIFGALMAFAKTGDPGWQPCSPGVERVMVWDRESGQRVNFDKELIRLHDQVSPPFSFFAPAKDDDGQEIGIQH